MTDYRWQAADLVMKKSSAALEVLMHQRELAQLRAAALAEPGADDPARSALIDETERAMEQASAALNDLSSTKQ
jgi:hypothetical protein